MRGNASRRPRGRSHAAVKRVRLRCPLTVVVVAPNNRLHQNSGATSGAPRAPHPTKRGALFVAGRAASRKNQTKLSANRPATPSGTARARQKHTSVCARTAPAHSATCRRTYVDHRHRNEARRTNRPTRGARIYQPFYATPYPQPSIIGPATIWAAFSAMCHA